MKHLRLLLPLLTIPMLVACGDTKVDNLKLTSIAAVDRTTSTSIYYSCKKAQGTAVYTINVKESRSLDITSSVVLTGGTLGIIVKNSGGDEVYNAALDESLDFVISLEEYGKYKINIQCESFVGSFSFDWSKK